MDNTPLISFICSYYAYRFVDASLTLRVAFQWCVTYFVSPLHPCMQTLFLGVFLDDQNNLIPRWRPWSLCEHLCFPFSARRGCCPGLAAPRPPWSGCGVCYLLEDQTVLFSQVEYVSETSSKIPSTSRNCAVSEDY